MGGQFLVASGDPAKPFQAVDATLDDVPPPVVFLVECLGRTVFVRLVWDHRNDATVREPGSNPVGRISFVAGNFRWLLGPRCGRVHERDKALRFVLLPRTDGNGQRSARGITDEMQLGAEAALAASQGVVGRFVRRPAFSPPHRPPIDAPE